MSPVLNQRRLGGHDQITIGHVRECLGSSVGCEPLSLCCLPRGGQSDFALQTAVEKVVTLQTRSPLWASTTLAHNPGLISNQHQTLTVKVHGQG